MNTNPAAITVLCYGDSNTNGWCADDAEPARLPADERWTGRLQALLGDGFSVIEEGLGGRTTELEYPDRPGGNGRAYFAPCLLSHDPLDFVVIMLGTNDLKTRFDRTPTQVAAALSGFLDDVEAYAERRDFTASKVVLVSPIHVDDAQPRFGELCLAEYGSGAVDKSMRLAAEIERLADARGALFADAASVATAGDDGVHLSRDSHGRLAELVAAAIR